MYNYSQSYQSRASFAGKVLKDFNNLKTQPGAFLDRYRVLFFMASSIRHLCISIQGILENSRRKKINFMNHDNGKRMTDSEARQYLYDALSEGKKVLPVGEECEGFSYLTGCPGHPKEDKPNE